MKTMKQTLIATIAGALLMAGNMGAIAQTEGPSFDKTVAWLQETLEHRLAGNSIRMSVHAGQKVVFIIGRDDNPLSFNIKDVNFTARYRIADGASFVNFVEIDCKSILDKECLVVTDPRTEEKSYSDSNSKIETEDSELAESIRKAFLHLQKLAQEKKDLF